MRKRHTFINTELIKFIYTLHFHKRRMTIRNTLQYEPGQCRFKCSCREKDMEVVNVIDPGGLSIQDCKIATDSNHYKFYPPPSCPPGNYQQNYHNSESEKGIGTA